MKRTAGIVGIILAVVFLILGLVSTTPDKYIRSYGEGKMYEYVGGDAYNFIIEASLRGGEISGAKTARAIFFSAAGILLVLSLPFLATDEGKDEIRGNIRDMKKQIEDVQKASNQCSETLADLKRGQEDSLRLMRERQEPTAPPEEEAVAEAD